MPQNLMHKTLQKVVVNGHKIPAGTTIVPQISCVLFDEKVLDCLKDANLVKIGIFDFVERNIC